MFENYLKIMMRNLRRYKGYSFIYIIGLVSFSIGRRTKEIGIRKVLGASVSNIIKILLSDFIRLIMSGTIIALPVSYYLGTVWLQNFAYRTSINVIPFVVAVIILHTIVIFTVGMKVYNESVKNPVNALKYQGVMKKNLN